MEARRLSFTSKALVILVSAITLSSCASGGISTRTANGQTSLVTWPFAATHGQWTIVNGYRGAEDHAPGGSPNDYALFALDFAKCLPDKVRASQSGHGACDLSNGWDNTVGEPVYAPVNGTAAWPDDACNGLAIDVSGHPGFRIALFHIDPLSGGSWSSFLHAHPQPFKQGEQIGTVSASGCVGIGNHIHMVVYSCAHCSNDPAGERKQQPFDGSWAIGGCRLPDDRATLNEYKGVLAPCTGTAIAAATVAPTATATATTTPYNAVSGTWRGQGTYYQSGQSPFDMTLHISVSGATFMGTLQETIYGSVVAIDGQVTGATADGLQITFTDPTAVSGSGIQLGCTYNATVSGGKMSGEWSYPGASSPSGALSLTQG